MTSARLAKNARMKIKLNANLFGARSTAAPKLTRPTGAP
jgi:hypothetical protein